MRRAEQIASLLLACTREHDWSEPQPRAVELARQLPPDDIISAATYHRVVGCVAASLRDADVPDALAQSLAAAARRSTGYAVLSGASLRAVRDALGDDVPWLVFKGPVLDSVVYPRPRLRTYRDLDVLVHPHHFASAISRLGAVGYRVLDQNWVQLRERMVSQLHLEREGTAPIDLHWTLVFDESMRQTFRFDPDVVLARARRVEIGGAAVPALDPADMLLHLAVHAAGEGAGRLVWLKDVDAVCRAGVDWAEVADRAVDAGVTLPTTLVLARSAYVLGAPVPRDVIESLAPRSWRALSSAADALFPVARGRGVGSPATLLARAARNDVATTIRVAASGLLQRTRSSIVRRQLTRPDRRFDPAHTGSLLHPAGDDNDRDAYFARIRTM